jgi:hypothetical protein
MERFDPSRHLPAPELTFDDDRIAAFERIYRAMLESEPGALIDYRCAYPKHEFLGYLVERKPVVLHGSNNPEIELFEPVRRSLDRGLEGSLNAVYATVDGVWPIFFALTGGVPIPRRDPDSRRHARAASGGAGDRALPEFRRDARARGRLRLQLRVA